MNVIIDSGSTKSDWYVTSPSGKSIRKDFVGLNPRYMTSDQFSECMKSIVYQLGLPSEPVQNVHFYSTGLSKDNSSEVSDLLKAHFQKAKIEIQNDLIGSARATCQRTDGIIGILGTGSNSGLYLNGSIHTQVPNLGYILGDEGGGVDIGKRLIKAFFHDPSMPPSIRATLSTIIGTRENLLEQLYGPSKGQTRSSRIAAVVLPIAQNHREDPYFLSLVLDSISDFLDIYIKPLIAQQNLPLHLCGSVALEFKDEIVESCNKFGIELGHLVKRPMEGLIKYHMKKDI